jgi:ABC-type multidrug transport system fused ATPase/permease subunit
LLPDFDRDLLATYLRPHRSRLILLAVLLFTSIGLQLANPQLAKTFVDDASAGAPFADLVRIAALFLAAALLTQLASVAEVYVAEDLGWRTTNALRVDLTRHVLGLDDSFHAEHGPGELIERIDGDVAAIAGFFARFVVHVLGSGLFLAGVLVLLWREDWRIGALLTACSVAAVLFLTRGGGFVGRSARAAREANGDLSAYLEEHLSALPDLKANGADAHALRGLHERLAARFVHGRRAILSASLFSSTVNVLLVGATAAALTLSAVLQRRGVISVGSVFLVFRYTGMLRMPLERLARHLNSFQQATGGIVRVRELLAIEPRVVDGTGDVRLPSGPLAVEVDHVSFAYDDDDGPVLRDVSFALAPGEVLGLLGRTGSGKTTISRLLCRLHDTDEGGVRLGGVDVRDATLDDLRARTGLVTQDVQLFAGTLRDNVTLFDATIGDDRLRDVFDALDLASWLAELPDGLDTRLGPTGRGLSAGEAQLVALTRIFLADPGLVVLDEASSRLDPHTEQLLEAAMSRLLAGRTGIVIAHRLATVERADHILILEDGEIAEWGRRADLAGDPTSRFSRLLRVGLREVLA